MRQTLYDFCRENGKDCLLAEWDAEKNGALTPRAVTPASNRRAWWRCPFGHSYAAVIADRAMRDHGCPYCAGRVSAAHRLRYEQLIENLVTKH